MESTSGQNRSALRSAFRSPRLYALAAVVAAAVLAQASGVGDVLTDRQRAEDLLTDTGPLGPALFVALFAVSHPVGLPSVALTFVAGLVWPAPLAVALALAGGMAGTTIGFWFARWIGRDWVAQRIPDRFRRLDARLARSGLGTVALVRLFTYLPPPADWLFGVSRLRFSTFATGTALGILPPTVVIVLAGDRVTEWIGDDPTTVLTVLGIALVAVAIVVAARRRWRRRAAPIAHPADVSSER